MTQKRLMTAELSINSLRNSGYKDTASALAEIIDNAVQAKATAINIMCYEKKITNTRACIDQLAIFDDGTGMSADTLELASAFGGTVRNSTEDLGKYGMGLPMASISKCKKLRVYSWESGEVFSTGFDIDEIIAGTGEYVEVPAQDKIPDIWKTQIERLNGGEIPQSGTLVVWAKLDRVKEKRGLTIYNRSQKSLGRMYRYFIGEGKQSKITFTSFGDLDQTDIELCSRDTTFLSAINDPKLAPWDTEPMFTEFREEYVLDVAKYNYPLPANVENGADTKIKVRFTIAKPDVQLKDGNRQGGKPHGLYLAESWGVSMVRSNRELNNDRQIKDKDGYADRYKTIEVKFAPCLDELLGVDSKKQSANGLVEMISTYAELGRTEFAKLVREWRDTGDLELVILAELVTIISKESSNMLKALEKQQKNSRAEHRKQTGGSNAVGVAATKGQKKRVIGGEHDHAATLSDGKSDKELKVEAKQYADKHRMTDSERDAFMKRIFGEEDNRFEIYPSDFGTKNQLFYPEFLAKCTLLNVNQRHPFFKNLYSLINVDKEELDSFDKEKLIDMITEANFSFELFMLAWANTEGAFKGEDRDYKAEDMCETIRDYWALVLNDFSDHR
jgi:hypothetical protein